MIGLLNRITSVHFLGIASACHIGKVERFSFLVNMLYLKKLLKENNLLSSEKNNFSIFTSRHVWTCVVK